MLLILEGIEIVKESGCGFVEIEFVVVYLSDLYCMIVIVGYLLKENKYVFGLILELLSEFWEIFFGFYEGEKGDVVWNEIVYYMGYVN